MIALFSVPSAPRRLPARPQSENAEITAPHAARSPAGRPRAGRAVGAITDSQDRPCPGPGHARQAGGQPPAAHEGRHRHRHRGQECRRRRRSREAPAGEGDRQDRQQTRLHRQRPPRDHRTPTLPSHGSHPASARNGELPCDLDRAQGRNRRDDRVIIEGRRQQPAERRMAAPSHHRPITTIACSPHGKPAGSLATQLRGIAATRAPGSRPQDPGPPSPSTSPAGAHPEAGVQESRTKPPCPTARPRRSWPPHRRTARPTSSAPRPRYPAISDPQPVADRTLVRSEGVLQHAEGHGERHPDQPRRGDRDQPGDRAETTP